MGGFKWSSQHLLELRAAPRQAPRQVFATQAPGVAQGQAAKSGWVLLGRVFDAQLRPVTKFAVFLLDARNSLKSQFGFAYTDFTGYFVLNYAASANSLAPGAPCPPSP